MTKRPNTIKMARLLEEFASCDVRNTKLVRELQADTRKVLGMNGEDAAPAKRKRPAREKPVSRNPARTKAARRKPPRK